MEQSKRDIKTRLAFVKANPHMKTSELVKALGVTDASIVNYKHKLGLLVRKRILLRMNDRKKVKRMLHFGETMGDIAEQFGVSLTQVRRIKKEMQVEKMAKP